MTFTMIEGGAGEIVQSDAAQANIDERIVAACGGVLDAFYDLGVMYSTGSGQVTCDLVEAHKWFNIGASKGHDEAAWCRADIAEEMTAREIAEAQRRAREFLLSERKAKAA